MPLAAPIIPGVHMLKKLIVLAVVVAAGYVVYNRISSARAERDLWNEATAVPDIA